MDDLACKYNDEVVCPYCGYVHSNSWELIGAGFQSDGDEITDECSNCGKSIIITLEVSQTYSTRKSNAEVK